MSQEKKPVRSGIKTTEFWLTLVATICGALMSAGVIADGTKASAIVGAIISVLAVLGYQAQRTKAKK